MSEYIEGGYALTPLRGKIPQEKNWPATGYEIAFDRDDFPENFGIVLQHEDLVIDCDPRAYEVGDDPLKRFCEKINCDLPSQTFTVKTGAGGLHIYLKKPKEFPIRTHVKEFPGLEFKTKGAQVVGAGCVHPDTKKIYRYQHGNPKTVLKATNYLLLQIQGISDTGRLVEAPQAKFVADDNEQNISRFREYLKICTPAHEGKHGDATTYMTAVKGKDFGLSSTLVYEIMLEDYNPRCVPPWSASELRTKVRNAYRYGELPQGVDSPLQDFTDVTKGKTDPDDLLGNLERNAQGQYKKTLANAIRFFSLSRAPFYKKLCWNEFTEKINIVDKLPWHDRRPPDAGMDWTDSDEILCKAYLAINYRFEVPVSLIHEAVHTIAFSNKNHPVKNYLDTLKWDGEERLDTWLIKYCGVSDSAYARAVARKTLVGAVARIYNPGCKFDFMLVLEGDQGIGKSRAVKALGGPWYGDLSLIPHEKDTIAIMRGKWIIEASEMAFQSRSEADQMKAFISRQEDIARLSYERNEKPFPRKCIFIGTINPEVDSGYLKDQTGNRRFWPVETGSFDVPGLEGVRDQLFAEAVVKYQAGEALYFQDMGVKEEAAMIQEAKRVKDIRGDAIGDWLDSDEFGARRDTVTSLEVWTKCLGGTAIGFSKKDQRELGHIMQVELGWINKSIFDHRLDKVVRAYCRPK